MGDDVVRGYREEGKRMRLASIFNPERILAKADQFRDQKSWLKAAKNYRSYLRLRADNNPIWVQLGNVLKEAGEFSKSEAAYKAAQDNGYTDPDLFLQMGHLAKVRGDLSKAKENYLSALTGEVISLDAYGEVSAMGYMSDADEIISKNIKQINAFGKKVVFDVSDLIYYIGHHDNLSGIQRVQSCIIQAIFKYNIEEIDNIEFICYNNIANNFTVVDKSRFLEWLEDLSHPPAGRSVKFKVEDARLGNLFATIPLAAAPNIHGATFVLLGAAWVIPDYPARIATLKRKFSARFVMVFHDFIPIYARETCDQGTAEVFKEFVDQILQITDVALCVSQSTQRDLNRYCKDNGVLPPPSLVTRLGSGFHEFFEETGSIEPDVAISKNSTPYVLFVSTIEGRKNHQYILDVWIELEARGIAVPRILLVGRLGWRAEGAIQTLIETDFLNGKVEILEDISDRELKRLYEGALFTVYPSLYEGWGLPVSESLANGKVCVLSDRSSLPEVAGDFGIYIPLDDKTAAADVIANLLSAPQELKDRELKIRSDFNAITWETVAKTALDGCELARAKPARGGIVLIQTGVEYPVRQLRMQTHGLMGGAMLDALTQSHSGLILPATIKTRQKISGLLCRNADWHSPEDWGCWAKGSKAKLEFALDLTDCDEDEELLLFAMMRFMSPLLPVTLRIDTGHPSQAEYRKVSETDTMVISRISKGSIIRSDGEGSLLNVNAGFELIDLSADREGECDRIDGRKIRFGLRSFCVVKSSDTALRLRIAELRGFNLAV
ncbi:MAG: glycosyltransferase [Novosphingobium sp.]